jgi:uncharacterized protein DUF998
MRRDWITRYALSTGVAVPFLYYGSQAAAAPFFPGFSFLGTTASELGSDLSRHPAIFNGGSILQGIACLVSSFGFLLAFGRQGIHFLLAGPTSLAIALGGCASLWAGYYPLPDPRHVGHPAFLIALLSLPVLFTMVLWRGGHSGLRTYLVANLILLATMVPIMSGMSGLDTNTYRGLFQRLFSFTVFPPIAVAAFILTKRLPGERPLEKRP